jgi:hypothetical protein
MAFEDRNVAAKLQQQELLQKDNLLTHFKELIALPNLTVIPLDAMVIYSGHI